MVEEECLTELELWNNFLWMATSFSLSTSAVTTPAIVASSLLNSEIAYIGNGLLYASTCASSLFLAAPLVGRLGPKCGLLIGLFFSCVYIGGFAVATSFGDSPHVIALACYLGSLSGGVATGVSWTSQGDYFACTAKWLAARSGEKQGTLTAKLGSTFAIIFLLLEVCAKLAFSCMQWLSIDVQVIAVIFLATGAFAFLMMLHVYPFTSPRTGAALPTIFDAVSLWSDPVIWLLAPTNLTFGFCAAFMNGYVNGNYAKNELGGEVVGLLTAITAAIAAIFSKIFDHINPYVGKGGIISLGSMSFLCIPLCFFVLDCCEGWGWWLLALYILQGSGRAVYESTNKAVFADFFMGSKRTAGFANCMLQSSLAFAASFFLQTTLSNTALAGIVTVLSMLTPICFVLARRIKNRRNKLESALLSNAMDNPVMGA